MTSSPDQGMVVKSFAGLSRAIPLHIIHPVLDAKDSTISWTLRDSPQKLCGEEESPYGLSSDSMDAHVVPKPLRLGRCIRLPLRRKHRNDHGHELHCLSIDNDGPSSTGINTL